jgi:raffinose/stachyose/melibiose transport system substrate-binding protein
MFGTRGNFGVAAMSSVLIAGTLGAFGTGAVVAQDQTTLTIWNQTADPQTIEAFDAVIADFEAANPTIKVEQTRYESDQLSPLVKNAFRSDSTPDLAYTEVTTARELDSAGLAANLDSYAQQYDWLNRISADGRAWSTNASGNLFGVGIEGELNSLIWDKTALEGLGLEVPTTMDDLVNVCKTARDAGLVPIASGDNGAGWIWYFYLGDPILNMLGPEGEISFAKHESGAWTDPDIRAAIESVLVTAKDAGCFIPEMSTLDNNTAIGMIESGKALGYFPGCTCNLTPIQTTVPDHQFAFTPWPEVPNGKGRYHMQGMGSVFVVNEQSTAKDAAAAFLDYLVQKPTAGKLIETAGILPPVVGVNVDDLNVNDALKQGAHALSDPGTGRGLSIDLLSSSAFNDTMGRLGQEVFGGQITIDEFLQQLQAAWATDAP